MLGIMVENYIFGAQKWNSTGWFLRSQINNICKGRRRYLPTMHLDEKFELSWLDLLTNSGEARILFGRVRMVNQ